MTEENKKIKAVVVGGDLKFNDQREYEFGSDIVF